MPKEAKIWQKENPIVDAAAVNEKPRMTTVNTTTSQDAARNNIVIRTGIKNTETAVAEIVNRENKRSGHLAASLYL